MRRVSIDQHICIDCTRGLDHVMVSEIYSHQVLGAALPHTWRLCSQKEIHVWGTQLQEDEMMISLQTPKLELNTLVPNNKIYTVTTT